MIGGTNVAGLLLAAGSGRRAGGPKALRRDRKGTPWVVTAARTLNEGGCEPVFVVTGCRFSEVVRELGGEPAIPILAADWVTGLAASLRAGITAALRRESAAILVHLVDLPDVGPEVVSRILGAGPVRPTTLRRAAYDGRPGHPVLIGATHLPPLLVAAVGDTGARDYLSRHEVELIPCDDLADGRDVDGPARDQPRLATMARAATRKRLA